ncbi:MAG: DUF2179 domain-containing protein [Chloroflexota bacterium]
MGLFTGDHGTFFVWVVVPILIMCARIVDVSLGTMRIILIGKGYKKIAPLLGWMESFIWIVAISQIMKNLDNFLYFVAYSTGYAIGTYMGIIIESKLSLGQVILRVITRYNAIELLNSLKAKNYYLTTVSAEGAYGKVLLIFMVIHRSKLNEAVKIVKEYNPNAFYSVEDVRMVNQLTFPPAENGFVEKINIFKHVNFMRK